MADTKRNLAALQALLADNTAGDISPQDIRDLLVSVFADVDYGGANHVTAAELKAAVDAVNNQNVLPVGMAFETFGDWVQKVDALRDDSRMYPTPIIANRHQCFTFRGKYHRTYFCWRASTANNLAVYVNYYDYDDEVFGTPVLWGIPQDPATDNHCSPNIFVAPDGHIIIVQEQLTTGGTSHNSPHHIRISDNPEDISSWTAIANSPILDDVSYPNIVQLPDGKLVLGLRYSSPTIYYYRIGIVISEDYGRTWKKLDDTICDGTGKAPSVLVNFNDVDIWAYNSFYTLKDGVCCLIRQQDHATYSGYPNCFLLFSIDGVTWGNWQYYQSRGESGWSKNVETSGEIISAELLAYCHASGTGTLTGNNSIAGHIANIAITDDYVAFLEPEGTRTSVYNYTDWFLTRIYKDGSITKKSFIDNSPVASATYIETSGYWLIPLNNNGHEYDLYVNNLNAQKIERYRTRNAGDDWIKLDDVSANTGDYSGLRGCPFHQTGTFTLLASEGNSAAVFFSSFLYQS